ncbi:MAG: S-layer homology domain-containing protein, partial [Clostridia bacterium]|nr:S-layer homology domain-containing protein [Clostridia bacterium]
MRNLKKFFALVLAMLMIVSATAIVSADFADVAADNIYAKAINDLADKKITVGGDSGFNPDGMVTRWQMALFVARAMTGEVDNAVWANGINIFDDVNDGHYKGAISHAYLNNVILGVGDNKFNPDGNITYGAALKMAVCALGYEVKYDATNWALAFYGKAQELGLTAGVAVYDLDKELTRAETAQIIYNMIYAAPAAKDAKTFAAANFGGIIGVAEDTL